MVVCLEHSVRMSVDACVTDVKLSEEADVIDRVGEKEEFDNA